MACHSCGGFEHYTEPVLQNAKLSLNNKPSKNSSCPTKEMMNNCMYTAQGVFICNKDDGASNGVAKNVDMMDSVMDHQLLKSIAPWSQ